MTINVIMIGQSNAVGLGFGGLISSSVDSRVNVWNNNNTSVGREPGSKFIGALLGKKPFNANGPYQNSGLWFCNKLAKLTGEDVRLMVVARGSTPIDYFDNRTTNPLLYNELIANWTASNMGPANFLIHCGHENNRFDSANLYSEKQDYVISSLKLKGVIDDNTVVVITGVAEGYPAHKNLNDTVLRPYCALRGYSYAESTGLTQYDESHFVGQAYVEMGSDRIFNSLPFDSYEAAPFPDGVIDYGITSNGEYWHYHNGTKRIRWSPSLSWVYDHSLFRKWDFPIKFKNTPHVSATLTSMESQEMGQSKIGGSCLMVDEANFAYAQIRLQSNSLYTAGNERMGVILEAVGE